MKRGRAISCSFGLAAFRVMMSVQPASPEAGVVLSARPGWPWIFTTAAPIAVPVIGIAVASAVIWDMVSSPGERPEWGRFHFYRVGSNDGQDRHRVALAGRDPILRSQTEVLDVTIVDARRTT